MSVSLIVFDLDGTLVDSKRDLADAANALITELGGSAQPENRIADMVGEGAAVFVRRALTASHLDPDTAGALPRFLALYDERLLTHTALYPGVRDALEALAPVASLAVLTNKPSRATEQMLDGLGIRAFFGDVIGGDTPFGRKPNPAGLVELMSRATATPTSTLLVGDSRIDLQTARAAGTRICLARYGFGYRFDEKEFDGKELFVDAASALVGLASR